MKVFEVSAYDEVGRVLGSVEKTAAHELRAITKATPELEEAHPDLYGVTAKYLRHVPEATPANDFDTFRL